MLTNLYVKNLALIDEAEIEFTKGLNIMSGETGAGKSIILDSINLALGAKGNSDIIGKYGDSALVEITFSVDDDKKKQLEKYDIYAEDSNVIISRRIFDGKSVIKINGETTSATMVKKVTELLIDIHGQHEHQSLLKNSVHLEILDKYAKNEINTIKDDLKKNYKIYKEKEEKLKEFTISEEEKVRNISFLQYEIEEIENANLKHNEDVEIENEYRLIINSKKISEELEFIDRCLNSNNGGASDGISRSLMALGKISEYDNNLKILHNELNDIENLLNDFSRDMSSYISSIDFDERAYVETEKRLDLINSLKAKHGGSLDSIEDYLKEAREKLVFYTEYEKRLENAKLDYNNAREEVDRICSKLTTLRKKSAKELEKEIVSALNDLNFLQVKFEIKFSETDKASQNGKDEVCFMISLNPGEEVKELSKIASGGELSRIMLGLKSVLAGKDDIDSLIFDEIDTGISGRTAQKVSEKMAGISTKHQVICITHLPQIAAMADTHFLIEKNVVDEKSKTQICKLNEENSIIELSRMLGGTEITDKVIENAREMKVQAIELKKMSV